MFEEKFSQALIYLDGKSQVVKIFGNGICETVEGKRFRLPRTEINRLKILQSREQPEKKLEAAAQSVVSDTGENIILQPYDESPENENDCDNMLTNASVTVEDIDGILDDFECTKGNALPSSEPGEEEENFEHIDKEAVEEMAETFYQETKQEECDTLGNDKTVEEEGSIESEENGQNIPVEIKKQGSEKKNASRKSLKKKKARKNIGITILIVVLFLSLVFVVGMFLGQSSTIREINFKTQSSSSEAVESSLIPTPAPIVPNISIQIVPNGDAEVSGEVGVNPTEDAAQSSPADSSKEELP